MQHYLTKLEELRLMLLSTTTQLTNQQMNHKPIGFNNNIIWNMGHLVVVSDDILYSSIESKRPQHQFDVHKFRKGTKPEADVDGQTIASIRNSLSVTAPSFRELLDQASLAHPELQYDKVVRSIISNASMSFLIFHEQMHIQAIDNIKSYL